MISIVTGVNELDPAQVLRWFHNNPEQNSQLLDFLGATFSNLDTTSIDVVVEELKFYGSDTIEPFPIEVLDLLSECSPVWEDHSYGTEKSWVLYNILWFYVSEVRDISGDVEELRIWSVDSYDSAILYLQELSDEDSNDFASYLLGESKNMKPIDDGVMGGLARAQKLYERVDPATLQSQGLRSHRLELYERTDGSFIVLAINWDEAESWIEVASIEEGRDFIESFW